MIFYSIMLLKWFCMLLRSLPSNCISDVWVSNNLQLVHISVDIQTKHIGNIIGILLDYCNIIAIFLHWIYSVVDGIFTRLVYQLALCALIQYNIANIIINIINIVQYIYMFWNGGLVWKCSSSKGENIARIFKMLLRNSMW